MFAITFDLVVEQVRIHHNKNAARGYEVIRRTLNKHGFIWKQGSVYINPDGGLVELLDAMNALKSLGWFPKCVREIRAFRLENNSEFTEFLKS